MILKIYKHVSFIKCILFIPDNYGNDLMSAGGQTGGAMIMKLDLQPKSQIALIKYPTAEISEVWDWNPCTVIFTPVQIGH